MVEREADPPQSLSVCSKDRDAGISTINLDPFPSPSDSAHILPPLFSTITLPTYRPRPVPPTLRRDLSLPRENLAKRYGSSDCGMPMPVSETVTLIQSVLSSSFLFLKLDLDINISLRGIFDRVIHKIGDDFTYFRPIDHYFGKGLLVAFIFQGEISLFSAEC